MWVIRLLLILAFVIPQGGLAAISPKPNIKINKDINFTITAPLRVPDRFVSWGIFKKKSSDEKSLMRWLTKGPRWHKNQLVIPVELARRYRGWPEGSEFLVPAASVKRISHLKLALRESIKAEYFIPEKSEIEDEFSYLNIRKISLKKKACGPVTDELIRWIKSEAKFQHVPDELMLALQKVETQGNCQAFRQENDKTQSIGLFQINTKSSKVKACTPAQKSVLKSARSMKVLNRKNLTCLENPRVNTLEALRIIKEKYRWVNAEEPVYKPWTEMNSDEKMHWQKAVSAYNGGQVYVIQAKKEISKFNSSYEAEFNTDDWGIRQAFMIRALIEKNTHFAKNSKSSLAKRNSESTLINLAYVEKVSQIAHAIAP